MLLCEAGATNCLGLKRDTVRFNLSSTRGHTLGSCGRRGTRLNTNFESDAREHSVLCGGNVAFTLAYISTLERILITSVQEVQVGLPFWVVVEALQTFALCMGMCLLERTRSGYLAGI